MPEMVLGGQVGYEEIHAWWALFHQILSNCLTNPFDPLRQDVPVPYRRVNRVRIPQKAVARPNRFESHFKHTVRPNLRTKVPIRPQGANECVNHSRQCRKNKTFIQLSGAQEVQMKGQPHSLPRLYPVAMAIPDLLHPIFHVRILEVPHLHPHLTTQLWTKSCPFSLKRHHHLH